MAELLAFLVGLTVPVMVWLVLRIAEEEEYELRHEAAAKRLHRELP